MKTNILILLSALTLGITSCKKDKEGCTDSKACNYDAEATVNNGTCDYCNTSQTVNFNFTQNYDLTPVTYADFDVIKYTNQFGNAHSITRLRYLVSNIALHKSNGDSVLIDGYNFVDLATNTGLTYSPSTEFPYGSYTGISFTWGFDENDNVSGIYPDLNAASWSWPMMLGGGYHFMQFEGRYIDTATDTVGFAYHNGIAREITSTPDTIYHPNHFRVHITGSNAFTLSEDYGTTIEIKMNIAEWFKNPNTWDLNQYGQMLMPNYQAQILMNQNGRSVFDYTVIQN